mgnify:CR=1 FL=1
MSASNNPVEPPAPPAETPALAAPDAPAPAEPGSASTAATPPATNAPGATPHGADPVLDANTDRLMRAAVGRPGGDEPSEAEIDKLVAEAMGGVSSEHLQLQNLPSGRHRNEGGGLKRGRITRVTAEDVFVDLGGKSEGILPKGEFDDPSECTVGKEVLVTVAGFDKSGTMMLSKRTADSEATWRALKPGDIMEGHVVGMNKGGLELKCKGFRAFMPAGQCDVRHVPDVSVFLNQKFPVEVMKIDPAGREVVVSRRKVVERELVELRRRTLNELVEGQLRTGTVRSVMDFGAFVDLGGVDGLLHVSDISYARVRSVGDFVKVGDLLECKVLKIDRDKGKISLGLKQKKADPWVGIEERYPVGSRLKGRVMRLAPFGAFVELEEGVEGLVHISEMSWIKRLNHPSELIKDGDIVEAVVLKIDVEKKEVRLGMKQVEANPWEAVATKYAQGTVHNGKVTRTSDFGAFIELESGIEGLAHISELSDKRVNRVTDVASVGKELRVKVLSVDIANRRIGLSVKQAIEAPPPKVLTPEEIAAQQAAAAAAAAAAAKEAAERAKKREKLRGGLGGGLGGLGKINLKG